MACKLFAEIIDELMWEVEDEDRRILHRIFDGRIGMNVMWQINIRKVLDILMKVVDQRRELLGLCAKIG